MRELDIHKMLSQKYLIRLNEIIDDESDDKVYLVMEYAPNGQILDYDKETCKFSHFVPGGEYDSL
jgi:serine/threonine protein kinase